jgi:osmoprotectant transport system substrate-binding protein
MNSTRVLVSAVAALTALMLLCGCASKNVAPDLATPVARIRSNPANVKVKLTIGAKNFTEQRVLGELYAQALSAAGYTVKTKFDLPNETTAFAELKAGTISGYPEYTGTVLLSLFKLERKNVPNNQIDTYDLAKRKLAGAGIAALSPTPFSSSNAVAMTRARSEATDIDSLAELAGKTGDLTLYGPPECRQREDCLVGLEREYAADFKQFVPIDPAERHQVLLDGRADMSIVFTTDPQIKRDGLVVLKDPDGMFPAGNATFLTKTSTVRAAGPDYAKTIASVTRRLTTPTIQQLIASVDYDGKSPKAVAAKYLASSGYVK